MPEMSAGTLDHRRRVLEAMAHAVSRKGYADTTIADIVGEAGVSRRTFYEHFTSKADCLIALYEAASRGALKVLRDAIDPNHGWQTQVDSALRAYFECLASNPVLVRTLFIEILHLGAEGLLARRRVNREIADFIVATAGAGAVNPSMAMAIVGGINELVLEFIEQDKVTQLGALVEPASRLVHLVTQSQAAPRA